MVTDDYAEHVADVTKALGGKDKAAATEVNMVRFVEGADIRIYGKKNYIATILADVGLGRPAVTDQAKDGFSYDVSPEKIDLADADAVFHSTYGDPAKSKETQTTGSGLWKKHGRGEERQGLRGRRPAVDPGHRLHGGRQDPRRAQGRPDEVAAVSHPVRLRARHTR
ncbi:hypothetical protein SMICM17S_12195 [Streptomyces microflavus]